MSQNLPTLRLIEKEAGLEGLVLRPLSAKLLPPTIPEQKGWVDREKLYDISGRGRDRQLDLAKKFGLKYIPQPAGGCLLTMEEIGKRVFDQLEHKEWNCEIAKLVPVGRHFRLPTGVKVIVARNKEEVNYLKKFSQTNLKLMDYDYDILKFCLSHIGEKFSLYQIYQILKKTKKLSKDKFYNEIERLQKDKVIFFVDRFASLNAPKKLFSYNFGYKTALTYDKNVTALLENMVFLELDEEVYYLDNVNFYLPEKDKIILVYPFIDEEKLVQKLKKLPKKIKFDKIEVVTISNEYELSYKNIKVEVKPFWIWAFVE
jgi:hypothetical protein